MIPHKLQIKNFVSYGAATQTIDFTPYQLICLSGKNGHGKSALLDAFTWALWGAARKTIGTSKADEGLLKIGQSNMMVSLDFSCNGNMYRVRREFTQSSAKSFTNLDFGIIEPGTGAFKALTDKTIRSTQEKIETMIGLTYDAFINSAFLRQGQSNEFSKKSPKERKEILASILGIDQYERLRKIASDKAREADSEKEILTKQNEILKTELSHKKIISEKLRDLQTKLSDVTTKESDIKQNIEQIKQEFQKISQIKTKAESLEFQKQQLSSNIKEQTTFILEESKKWREIQKKHRHAINYNDLDTERIELQKQLQNIQALINKKISLREQLLLKKEADKSHLQKLTDIHNHELEHIKNSIQQLKLQIQANDQKLKEIEQQKHKEFLELDKINKDVELFENEAKKDISISSLEKDEKQFERRKAFYHKYVAQGNALKTELKNIDDRQNISQLKDKPICPLCEQNLAQQYKESLFKTLKKQKSFITHQLTRLSMVIKNLKIILFEQNDQIDRTKKQIETMKLNEVQLVELQKNKQRLTTQTNQLEYAIAELNTKKIDMQEALSKNDFEFNQKQTEFKLKLHSDDYYQNTTQEIQKLEADLIEIAGNPLISQEIEKKVNQRLQELTNLQNNHNELLKELAAQDQRKANITKTIKAIKQLKITVKYLQEESNNYINYKEHEINIIRKEQELLIKLQNFTQEKEVIIHQKGALEQQLATIAQKENESQAQEKKIKLLNQNAEEYSAIAAALGKDGIQALLIEDAIPEIESEANSLLARLTDNQSHLSIESLRDLKSGKTKETLDIKISDSVGIRPYEMFSGGEAFRIDFALRIAISKLLARRAGTSLQTLIIDEGFGSQDEEGLANIMEAIYKIQEDFSKVIIVSHLASMKEQFPVHFNIFKGADGSSIKVIEHA